MSTISIDIHDIAAVKARRCNAARTGNPSTEWLSLDLIDAEGNVLMSVTAYGEPTADQPVEVSRLRISRWKLWTSAEPGHEQRQHNATVQRKRETERRARRVSRMRCIAGGCVHV